MKKGFSLAELLMVMVITGVLLMAMMPVFTTKKNEHGTNSNANYCILTELQNNQTMDITQANCTANPNSNCCRAVDACTYDMNNSCETMIFYADNGQDRQRDSARKALREACDRGGEKACEYFVKSCAKDSNNCNITSGNSTDFDLSYYLGLSSNSNNTGRLKIKNYTCSFYAQKNANVKNMVNSLCSTGLENNTACEIKTNCSDPNEISCTSAADGAEKCIKACNNADSTACQISYDQSWNRNCTQIKNSWSASTSGTYTITANGAGGNEFQAYCDQTNDGGGWTLALKAAGNATTFQYNSAYWTDSNTYNDSETNMNKTEHKNKAFLYVPFTQTKVLMDSNSTQNSLILAKVANNLTEVFNNGYQPTLYGESTWRTLVPNSSMQEYCNLEGFNATWVRLGFTANEDAPYDCTSNNSNIGLGTKDHDGVSYGAGNRCRYTCDNANKDPDNHFGYLFVKGEPTETQLAITNCTFGNSTACTTAYNSSYNRSCSQILSVWPTAPSGMYKINPVGPAATGAYNVFCDMTNDGGGWTLLAKIDNNKRTTFDYNSSLWTNTGATYNNNLSIYPTVDGTEHRNPAFNNMSFTKLRFSINTSIIVDAIGSSLANFFSTTVANTDIVSLTKAALNSLLTGSILNADHANDKKGFNVKETVAANDTNRNAWARFGYVSRQGNDVCALGIGLRVKTFNGATWDVVNRGGGYVCKTNSGGALTPEMDVIDDNDWSLIWAK